MPAAGVELLAGGGEVVEHVERGELEVAADVLRGQVGRPGLLEGATGCRSAARDLAAAAGRFQLLLR